jgi:hypothetical protein
MVNDSSTAVLDSEETWTSEYLEEGWGDSTAETVEHPPVAEAIQQFFTKVVMDGRFIELAKTDPVAVAEQLELYLTPEAKARIEEVVKYEWESAFCNAIAEMSRRSPKQFTQNDPQAGIVVIGVLAIVIVLVVAPPAYKSDDDVYCGPKRDDDDRI